MQSPCRSLVVSIIAIAALGLAVPVAAGQDMVPTTPGTPSTREVTGAQNDPSGTASEDDTAVEDLEAAYRQIDYLERRIAQLEASLKAAQIRVPTVPDSTSQSDDINLSAPPGSAPEGIATSVSSEEIVAAYRLLYQAQYGASPIPDATAGKDHRLALDGLKRFVVRCDDELYQRIRWNIKIMSGKKGPRASTVQAICVDPQTGAEIGKPFVLTLDRALTRKIDSNPSQLFTLDGMLQPAAVVNPALATPKAFDDVPFIGPYLEFRYRIRTRNIIPAGPKPA